MPEKADSPPISFDRHILEHKEPVDDCRWCLAEFKEQAVSWRSGLRW